ncbi:MAG: potassium transporter TrkG [Pseudomonadota bacterium]
MSRPRPFSDGADTLRVRARPSVVALTLAKHAPIFALLYLPPAAWAAVSRDWSITAALCAPALIALGVYAAVQSRPLPQDLRRVEAMVSVALVFLLGAMGAVPTFVIAGMPLADALFEAMSGLTTTGLSVAAAPDDWPFVLHVLRAWLQWIGGLVMATAVLALLLPAGVPTQRLGQAGFSEGDRIASTRTKARQLLGVYLGLTVIMTAATALVIPDWREALVLTLSGISTGGFAPRSDSLASYTVWGQSVVMLTCLLGALSLVSFVLILQGKWRAAWRTGSARRVGLTVLALALAAVALAHTTERGDPYGVFLDMVSATTTAGYSVGVMPIAGPVFILFLVAMVLGADSGSTGGGIKLARLGLFLRAARHTLRAPSLPKSALAPLRQDSERVDDAVIIGGLALVMLYTAAAVLLVTQFAWHGYPLAESLFDSLSALSTVGLSTGIVGADLPLDLKLSLTFAMWLGRLEFIAVLVLLTPRTWLKGP